VFSFSLSSFQTGNRNLFFSPFQTFASFSRIVIFLFAVYIIPFAKTGRYFFIVVSLLFLFASPSSSPYGGLSPLNKFSCSAEIHFFFFPFLFPVSPLLLPLRRRSICSLQAIRHHGEPFCAQAPAVPFQRAPRRRAFLCCFGLLARHSCHTLPTTTTRSLDFLSPHQEVHFFSSWQRGRFSLSSAFPPLFI